MEVLKVEDLGFGFIGADGQHVDVLEKISFSIRSGEIALLIGENGSGKTTLMKCLVKAIRPKGRISGSIMFCNEPLDDLTYYDQVCSIGYISQDVDAQICCDRVHQQIAFCLQNIGLDQDVISARIAEVSTILGIERLMDRRIGGLSGGEKQLVDLASVLAVRPRLLLIDEPLSNLDPFSSERLLHILEKMCKVHGISMLVSEQELNKVFALADKVLVMQNGSLVFQGDPKSVAYELLVSESAIAEAVPFFMRIPFALTGGSILPPELPSNALQCREFLSTYILSPDREDGSTDRAGELDDNIGLYDVSQGNRPIVGDPYRDPVIDLQDVSFRYDRRGNDILGGLDLDIRSGEIVSIIGNNGSGKSTMLEIIAGFIRPYLGKVRVRRPDLYEEGGITGNRRLERPRSDFITMLPQEPSVLFSKKTVIEEVASSALDRERLDKLTLPSNAHEVHDLSLDALFEKIETVDMQLAKLIEGFKMKDFLSSDPFDISIGQAQAVALVKVLSSDASIILLDEPTSSLDVVGKGFFASFLASKAEEGCTIIIATHDLDFVAKVSDRTGILFNGRIDTFGPTREVMRENYFFTDSASMILSGLKTGDLSIERIVSECL